MNISGVTATVLDLPMEPVSAPAVSAAEFRSMVSVQVLDMAQNAFEDAAAELLAAMSAAITGVGQNVDMYV